MIPPQPDLERLVAWAVRWLANDREWEDIYQDALIAAWQNVRENEGRRPWTTLAMRAAQWSAGHYLRQARRRREVSLNALCEQTTFAPCTRDFAPALIERLENERIAREAWQLFNPLERELVARHLFAGQSLRDIARDWHVPRTTCQYQFKRAMNRWREQQDMAKREKPPPLSAGERRTRLSRQRREQRHRQRERKLADDLENA